MASLPHSKTVTYEEWLRLPEVKGEEVINGEIRIMPAPTWNHGDIVENLFLQIRSQVDPRQVRVRLAEFNLVIRLHPLIARIPDLAVFHVSTIVEKDGRIHSAPQLIAEVLSPANTRRDFAHKVADYASIDVPEIWVFSPEALTVEVLYLEGSQFRRHALLAEGILKPLHFPGVQIDIAAVWPD